jgi:hypothetical protein
MKDITHMADEIKEKTGKTPDEPKCTIGCICVAFESLMLLLNEKFEPGVSSRILQLARFAAPINEEVVELRRNEAVRLGGEPIEGGRLRIPNEHLSEFNTAVNGLTSKPAYVPQRLKLALSDLGTVKISPSALLGLRWFMRENGE